MDYLYDYISPDKLKSHIDAGYIAEQSHPTLPLKILNYTHKTQIDRKWDGITKMCRGLIYDTKSEHIIARPFPKFFNVGEPGGTSLDTIQRRVKDGYKLSIREKLDGSLGIFYKYTDRPSLTTHYGVATRGSFTSPQAIWATKLLNELVKTRGLAWGNDVTPLAEIIYPENRIVVDYPFSGLVILTITKNSYHTNELRPRQVREWAAQYGLPVAPLYAGKSVANLHKETRKNFEGYVIELFDGESTLRAKVKLDEYCRLHKIITGWNAKSVWELLRDGKDYTELLDEALPSHFRNWLKAAVTALTSRYYELEKRAIEEFKAAKAELLSEIPHPKRKDFALAFKKNEEFQHVFFNLLDKKNYSDILWDKIRPSADERFILDAEVAAEGAANDSVSIAAATAVAST
jgi:RNA ligase